MGQSRPASPAAAIFLVLALLVLAGCAAPKKEPAESGLGDATGAGATQVDGIVPLGLPPEIIYVKGATALDMAFKGGVDIFRVRLVANETFDFNRVVNTGGGGGGGGGGGSSTYRGAMLLPADIAPDLSAKCKAADVKIFDSRQAAGMGGGGGGGFLGPGGTPTPPLWAGIPAGSYDLWVWNTGTSVGIELNGGDADAATHKPAVAATGWTLNRVNVTLTGGDTPAMWKVAFDQAFTTPGGAIVLGYLPSPGAFAVAPSTTAKVAQGATCAEASSAPAPGTQAQALQVRAVVAPGEARWQGEANAAARPTTFGSSYNTVLLLLQPPIVVAAEAAEAAQSGSTQ